MAQVSLYNSANYDLSGQCLPAIVVGAVCCRAQKKRCIFIFIGAVPVSGTCEKDDDWVDHELARRELRARESKLESLPESR